MKKIFLVIIAALFITCSSIYLWFQYEKSQELKKILTFDQCASAGFPIMESYPEKCQTPDGRSFTRDIGNELELIDEIVVTNPRPNQIVSSPIIIEGRARGSWYFEANFSAELFDNNKKSLGTAIIQADGDWMSEDFVPFTSQIEFKTPNTSKGQLIFKNANPSGLPENEKKLIIPVEF